MINTLFSNTSNIGLQIIPMGIILISLAGEGVGEQEGRVPISLAPRSLVERRTSPWRNLMFVGGSINIANMMWMKIMDKSLI
jgi:hypothetical protein